jgi:hypothetical protein
MTNLFEKEKKKKKKYRTPSNLPKVKAYIKVDITLIYLDLQPFDVEST